MLNAGNASYTSPAEGREEKNLTVQTEIDNDILVIYS